MKKLLTILCLVLLSSYSYSKEVIPESQGETGSSKGPQRVYKYKTVRESSYYKKRPYEKFYENGQLKSRLNFKNGKPNGFGETYYENGQLELRVNIKDGEQHGLWEQYYENGQLKEKGDYKDGKEDGLWEGFHDNGQLMRRGNFKNGKEEGLREYFDEEGNLTKTEEFNYLKESVEFFKNLTTDPSRNKTR